MAWRVPWSCSCPFTGMVLAVLLHRGHLPRLFQRNLLYPQKSKFRVPRMKPVPGPSSRLGGVTGRGGY